MLFEIGALLSYVRWEGVVWGATTCSSVTKVDKLILCQVVVSLSLSSGGFVDN